MTTRLPGDDSEQDGSWFLEAVGATEPPPSAGDALAELTRENDVIDTEPGDAPTTDEARSHPKAEDPPATDTGPDTIDTPSDHRTAESPTDDTPKHHTTMIRTTQTTLSSFDGNPGTANATYAPTGLLPAATPLASMPPPLPIAPPPQQVAAPPPAPVAVAAATAATARTTTPPAVEEVDTEEPAAPDDLSRPLRTGRSFRWPVISVLVLLIALVAVAAFWLPRATDAKAVAVKQTYYDATAAVRNQLPATQGALDAITSTESTADELSASVPTIAQLDSLAREMERVASEPLPSVLPLVPKGAIDALEPLQQQTALLGTDGVGLATRLGNSYIYRIQIPSLLQTGNLPSSASSETINTVSITLAESLASDAEIVASLPSDPGFTEVRILAVSTQERYSTWQNEYLAALSAENTQGATTLLAELDQMRFDLNIANAAALGEMRSELDARVVSYAVELETHMSKLSQS